MAVILFPVALLMFVSSVADGQTCNKIVTSNVGLTPTVGDVDRRSKIVAEQYSKLDADVVCAQEFWHEEDIIRVLDQSPDFKYHYSPIHADVSKRVQDRPKVPWYQVWKKWKQPDKAACKKWETLTLATGLGLCSFTKGCISVDSQEAFATCIAVNCAYVLNKVSEDCVSCIFQTVAESIKEAADKCHSMTSGRRYNAPGLLLLSKKKMTAVYRRFFPNRMMLQRGYIEAEVEDVGTVVCTHLSSNLGAFFEYDMPSEITNYTVQQRVEIDLLEEEFGGRKFILLGDLNTGPEIRNDVDPQKNVTGEFPENYAHLISLGYRAPYITEVGDCTYCSDNPLIAYRYPNHIIDHILFRGAGYTINSAERILNFTQPEPMSDHYAVRMEVCD